jgi:UDP-N-acetylmuramate dehydrogenase
MSIERNVPLNDKNWFQTGGPARFFSQPTTEVEFAQALQFAAEQKADVFLLGHGANILISDDGFNGLVIRPQLNTITLAAGNQPANKQLVTAGAGVSIQQLIDWCLDHGLTGFEEFSGIPGTVGGSVFINIHYFQFLLSNFLVSARVIDRFTGECMDVDNAWFSFGYDQSKLFERRHYLVSATFAVSPADALATAYAKGRRDEIIRHRLQRYPRSNTCGSFFRNFHENELPFEVNGKKMPFVAYYLDKLGIKGALKVGNAVVSYQHANMLVTQPQATSADVINLARSMQQQVFDAFGIIPQPECQFVGFQFFPLM